MRVLRFMVCLGLMCVSIPNARASTVSVDTDALASPFADAHLDAALGHLRAWLVEHNTSLEPDPEHLDRAAASLAESLDSAAASDLPGAVLLSARVAARRGDATVAGATYAVAAMLYPEIGAQLRLSSAAEFRRAGPLPAEWLVQTAGTAFDTPDFVVLEGLLSADPHGADTAQAATTLSGGLRDGHDQLCAPALAFLGRVGVFTPVTHDLLPGVAAGCSGTLPGHVAAVLAAATGAPAWSTDQRLQAARRLYERVQHDAVIDVLAPLRVEGSATIDAHCEAMWRTAMTYRRSRRASQSEPFYAAMVEVCSDSEDWHTRALYGLGWNHVLDGRKQDAREVFERLLAAYPQNRYADDAIFYLVTVAVSGGDLDAALAAIQPLLDGTVAGDMAGDAVWRYVEAAMAEERDVTETLDAAYLALRNDRNYRSSGRLAWLRAVRSEDPVRIERLEAVLYEYPLTFYAYLALSELRALDAAEPLTRWQESVEAAREPTRGLALHDIADDLATRQAQAWWAGGFSAQAAATLRAQSAEANTHTQWLIAWGFHLEGRYDVSHEIARSDLVDWRAVFPTPASRLLWEIAFPLPYRDLVIEASARADISPALAWAIMREESGFRARVESYAHAIGLMQLLESTGASHARRAFGWEVDAESLRLPWINIPVGAAFLGHLANKLQPHTVLMAAGYNAGRGSVNKWLKARRKLPLQAFVESIPYTQTRDYSKRVNASFLVYQVLYGSGDVAPLPLSLSP